MRLIEFTVRRFRNFIDSGPIPVEEGVTCLVGKNESGKTAALQALARLNSARTEQFSLTEHYPRWLLTRDRKAGTAETAQPISVRFALDTADENVVAKCLGEGAMKDDTVSLSRGYDGKL